MISLQQYIEGFISWTLWLDPTLTLWLGLFSTVKRSIFLKLLKDLKLSLLSSLDWSMDYYLKSNTRLILQFVSEKASIENICFGLWGTKLGRNNLEIAGNLFVHFVGFNLDPIHAFQLHSENVLDSNIFAYNFSMLHTLDTKSAMWSALRSSEITK